MTLRGDTQAEFRDLDLQYVQLMVYDVYKIESGIWKFCSVRYLPWEQASSPTVKNWVCAREMAWLVKRLLHEHEGLSLNSQNPCRATYL